jgi:hypothetical protein
MNKTIFSILLLVCAVFTGCKQKEEGPEFKTVTDIDLGNIGKKNSKFSCIVVFSNPDDKAKYTVKQIMADLLINEKDAGTPINDKELVFYPRSECKVPLNFQITPSDFIKEDEHPKSLPVSLKGTLTIVNEKGKEIKIDFKHSESVAIHIKKEEKAERKLNKEEERSEKRARLLELKKNKKRRVN